MAFEVPPLPYGYDALQPTIDEQTMRLHHDKHHQAYVDKLNGAVGESDALKDKSLEQILGMVGSLPPVVRNNGGGHWNHSFFWEIMAPGGGGEPTGELRSAIEGTFGSLEALKEQFNTAGANQFGSGWAWLVKTADGKLQVTSTPNQDNPLMDIAPVKGVPVLGNDVWEHAYYLTYNNRRLDYLKAWWSVVNWDKAAENFARSA